MRILKSIIFVLIVLAFISSPLFAQGAGKALSFDGTNDYVEVGNGSSLNIGGSLTVEAWVYIDNLDDPRAIATKWHMPSNQRKFQFTVNDEGSILLYTSQDGSSYNQLATSAGTMSTGEWHHLVGVYETSDTKRYIYLDGVLVKSDNSNHNSLYNAVANNIYIGTSPDDLGGRYFNGTIDEVRIWNVALPADTIRKYMCRKVTSSHGYWSNLKGYWRFDGGSGQTAYDQTANDNDGTLGSTTGSDTNDPTWATSGAAIGDASANDYSGSGASDFSVNLAHTDGDDITATGDGGTVTGIQVYRFDEAPNVTTPPTNWDKIDPLRYWGVFIVGSSSPTYTVTYNYAGHPGITTESALKLAYRADNATTSWTDLGATLDEGANTLTKTGQSGTEYILGTTSSDNSLPIELTSFTARQERGFVVLEWVTESEIENLGFILERRVGSLEQGAEEQGSGGEWSEIASYITHPELQGQGSVTYRKEYQFVDSTVVVGTTYDYKLADVSYDCVVEYHALTSLTVEEYEPLPDRFTVYQNYPNPYNPTTTIRYDLPEQVQVLLVIYDLLGREVRILVNNVEEPGSKSVVWNGTDELGKPMGAGVYLYRIGAGKYTRKVKMVLIK